MEKIKSTLPGEETGLVVEYYVPGCNGRPKEMEIHNIYDEDKEYILTNNLKLTLEELPIGEFVIYLRHQNESEDKEIMVLAKDRTCQETIREAINIYKNKRRVND